MEAEQRIKDAEAAKIRIVATPGKMISGNNDDNLVIEQGVHQTNHLSAMAGSVDDNYLVIGAHVEPNLRQKIFRHEYIDFARLLTHDRITCEEDHRMEIVSKGGMTYFVPVADRENTMTISSFNRWEQAF